jgi:hypothetical protein
VPIPYRSGHHVAPRSIRSQQPPNPAVSWPRGTPRIFLLFFFSTKLFLAPSIPNVVGRSTLDNMTANLPALSASRLTTVIGSLDCLQPSQRSKSALPGGESVQAFSFSLCCFLANHNSHVPCGPLVIRSDALENSATSPRVLGSRAHVICVRSEHGVLELPW